MRGETHNGNGMCEHMVMGVRRVLNDYDYDYAYAIKGRFARERL